MPEFNLIEEEDGGSIAPSASAKRKAPPRGGGLARLLVIFLVLIIIVGGLYFANKYGIVKIWGRRTPPPVAQTQPEQYPQDPFAQEGQPAAQETPMDTTSVPLLETPPLETTPPAQQEPVTLGTTEQQMPPVTQTTQPEPPPQMKGNYTIQVSAWKDKTMADEMQKRLSAAGYPAFVEELKYKDGRWFTVRIGRYETRQAAAEAVKSMAYELRENYWIDRVRTQ